MSQEQSINKIIGKAFLEVADAIESGKFGERKKVGLTILGSEHGGDNMLEGATLARKLYNDTFDIVLIGHGVETDFELVEVENETEAHNKMEELLESGYLDACVTMHYTFPIGVSTVGKILTPAKGTEMLLATTTGTTAMERTEAMVKNALGGIAVAKASGISNPTVGLLNLDGSRKVESILKQLSQQGYKINFTESVRADGGVIMRGNDLLCGNTDVMVMDSLTGNILMKMFSSYTTGGNYEASGYGYGPGVGEDYDKLVLILSRASGVAVVANALKFAYDMALGNVLEKAREEYRQAKDAGLEELIALIKDVAVKEEVVAPPKEVVTEEISGIDVMDIEDAVKDLWSIGIYAESGMGCTGPMVLISEENKDKAVEQLKKSGYIID